MRLIAPVLLLPVVVATVSDPSESGYHYVDRQTWHEGPIHRKKGLRRSSREPRQRRSLLTGYGGSPDEEHLPLGECEGDCDDDAMCEGNLVCFQRDPRMAVPGCPGGEEETSRTDFCVDPIHIGGGSANRNEEHNDDEEEEEEEEEEEVNPPPNNPGNNSNASSSSSSSSSRSFFVALLADPQIGWNRDGYNSEELFREAASHLRELQPDLILVAGDLIQTPGNRRQFDTVKSILDSLDGIPYYTVAGNHDVHNNPRLDELNDFVRDWNMPYYWYTVRHYGTLFVMLDSNVLRVRDDSAADPEIVALAHEELQWLEETLKDAVQNDDIDRIVPIAHHPLAIRNLDENDQNTNTPQRVRRDLLNLYETYAGPKLDHVFAGHFHDSARIEHRDRIDFVTYPATGVILGGRPREPSGFAILRFSTADGEGRFREDYYGYDDMPDQISV